MPDITPKSLRALFIQLNCECIAIAISMQVKAIIGANMPVNAAILCRLGNFESSEILLALT